MINQNLSIFESLAEYGTLLVIAGVFLLAVIIMFNNLTSKYNKLFDYVLSGKINHKSPEQANLEASKAAVFNEQVHEILTVLLHASRASRVFYIVFHNGDYDDAGYSMRKMSVANEVTSVGVPSFMSDFQNQFQSRWRTPLSKIRTDGYYHTESLEKLQSEGSDMYEWLRDRGVLKSYLVGVRGPIGHEVGIICLEYLNVPDDLDDIRVQTVTKEAKYCVEALLKLQ